MSEATSDSPQELIEDPRPWAFTQAELTAGLRRHTGDPSLAIQTLKEREVTQRLPAIGKLRGLHVETEGTTGKHEFDLVVKEPRGVTRAGTAGAGLREASVYLVLCDILPVRLPTLIAAHAKGNWLVLDHLPPGRRPEKWKAADYLLATDQLVALHDRFWGLGQDLTIYPWLARPLDSDLNIHIQAAESGAQKLNIGKMAATLKEDRFLIDGIFKLVKNVDEIIGHLRKKPYTLLHGDFWPGNIHVHKNGSQTVYDWEHAAIGPGVLDLVNFVQASSWYFSPLPLTAQELTAHYRQRLSQAGTFTWRDRDWERDWDYALMWNFLAEWVDLLAKIPEALFTTRLQTLEAVVFAPLKAAIKRRLG